MKTDYVQLSEALQRFIERFQWFTIGRAPEEGMDTDATKILLAEWDETLEPWRGRIANKNLNALFEQLSQMIEGGRAKVRLMFLAAIHDLLETRTHWLLWERAVQMPSKMKQTLDTASPEERERLLAQSREILGKELDPAEMFQEAMVNADACEAAWNKVFDLSKKEWPDECTPELETRIRNIEAPAIAIWLKELREEMAAIQTKHPSRHA